MAATSNNEQATEAAQEAKNRIAEARARASPESISDSHQSARTPINSIGTTLILEEPFGNLSLSHWLDQGHPKVAQTKNYARPTRDQGRCDTPPDTPTQDSQPRANKIKKALQLLCKKKEEQQDKILKVKSNRRTPTHTRVLDEVSELQRLQSSAGAVWTLECSPCGTYIATGGVDGTVKVWVVKDSPEGHQHDLLFNTRKKKQELEANGLVDKGDSSILHPVPLREFSGHTADILDLAWSEHLFLLSASIDKTARLWHVSEEACISVYHHPDFVMSVSFHPTESRLFLSGSFDKKLRLWNMPERKVIKCSNESNVITSVAFSPTDPIAVAGLYSGEVVFHNSQTLQVVSGMHCRNRYGKDRNGKKVTGLSFNRDGSKLLVTTNDSRVRVIDCTNQVVLAKLKGPRNKTLQIAATFGEDGRSVICGSEDQRVYVWPSLLQEDGAVLTRNSRCQSFRVTGNKEERVHPVTCARFCPRNMIGKLARQEVSHFIATSGLDGTLRLFQNKSPNSRCKSLAKI